MFNNLLHRILFKLSLHRFTASFLLGLACFFAVVPTVLAAPVKDEYNVVNQNDIDALTKTTGLAADKVQDIKNQISGAAVKPEVTVPAEGGTVSGQNLFIKGVASPNVNVDLIIGSTNGKTSPLMGKTTSDKYGVWTYTLGPDLAGGSYTIQITAGTDGSIQSSEPLHFNVIAGSSSSESTGAGAANGFIANAFSGNNLMIIIIVIIISITFLVAVVILSIMPYARARKSDYANRLQAWTEPELAGLSEKDWQNFIKQTEILRDMMPSNRATKN